MKNLIFLVKERLLDDLCWCSYWISIYRSISDRLLYLTLYATIGPKVQYSIILSGLDNQMCQLFSSGIVWSCVNLIKGGVY